MTHFQEIIQPVILRIGIEKRTHMRIQYATIASASPTSDKAQPT